MMLIMVLVKEMLGHIYASGTAQTAGIFVIFAKG